MIVCLFADVLELISQYCRQFLYVNYASRYFYNASISAFISRKGASSFVQPLTEEIPQVAPAIE